jgi:hypothetical protein
MSWIGWLWLNGRWVDVCEGRTLAAASRRLDAEAQARGIRHNLHRGLTSGAAPTWPLIVPRPWTSWSTH